MKILWFTNTPCGASDKLLPDLVIGGWLSSLERELVKNKEIELHICFYWKQNMEPFKHNNTWYYPLVKKYKKNKLKRFAEKRYRQMTDDEYNVRDLLTVVEKVQPEIIHVHGTEENFGLVMPLANAPSIISIQGILSPYVEKYFSGISQSILKKHENNRSKYSLNSMMFQYNDTIARAKRERKILASAKNVMGRTDWDRNISLLLSKGAQYFVGNEILRDAFYQHKWKPKKNDGKLKVVSINSGGLNKGTETFFKATQIFNENSNVELEWTVIGQSDNDDMVALVKKWLKHKPVNVNFVGRKSEHEIVEILLNSDIFSQVSHMENSPNSVCEAMLLGMPIIASFAGGTSSIVADGQEGLLVQGGDPYAMAGALEHLCTDFSRAIELAENAYEKAHSRHNKENIASTLLETYKQIVLKA